MIDIKDIPKELLDRIKPMFDSNPTVVRMRVHQQTLARSGRYEEALNVAQQIEYLYDKCVCEYLEAADKEVQTIDLAETSMSLEDKERMMQLSLVCFMCSDMIESAIIDMDDVLHRYDKSASVVMFNDIRDAMKMAEEKLKFLQENSKYMQDLVWADNCDNMYQMIQNKAKSIMNKRKSSKDWGKNTEKFNK